ncbi:MAG TPA: signal peptide peptidase SppA, partial [Polyangiaceae bacterium]|nr:signal peptide peptidase SppA [Polyangiaceae bacterium]
MRRPNPHRFILAAVVATTIASEANAQTPPRVTDGVNVPYRSTSATDDASSIFVNPANLAFGPGPEARVTVVYAGEDAPLPVRGYSLDIGLPFWILATGLRVDWMDPSNASGAPFSLGPPGTELGQRYNWIRWANAIRLGEFASIGNTFAWSTSDAPILHGMFSVSSALTVRPNRFMSVAAVARDWNSPTSDGGLEVKPSADLAASFRPVGGRRLLELGLEGSYRSQTEDWVPSANAAVDIPYVGRLKVGASLLDPSEGQVVVATGLEVNLDALQLTGGALFGNALGVDGTGFIAGAAIRSFREKPHVPMTSSVVRLRLESTPGVREHVQVLRTLWQLADDREIDGLVLTLRASPADSLAHAEELVDAIELMKARGKKVMCHLEDASGTSLFVCSAADRIAINPAGGVRFAGLSTRYLYFGGLLEKLGVRADF